MSIEQAWKGEEIARRLLELRVLGRRQEVWRNGWDEMLTNEERKGKEKI